MLPSVAAEISASLTFCQGIADKLEIMLPGSECRQLFNTMKQRALKYLKTADKFGERYELGVDIDDVGDLLAVELSDLVPLELVQFMSYLQNVAAVIGITMHGESLDWGAGNVYMNTTAKLVPGAWTQEYMHVNDNLRELVRQSKMRELSEEEVGRLHELSVWQSENFLSHFRPHVFDLSDYNPNLTSLAKRHGLSLCPLVTDRSEEGCSSHDRPEIQHTTVVATCEETETNNTDKDSSSLQSGMRDSHQVEGDSTSKVRYSDGQESRGEYLSKVEDMMETLDVGHDLVPNVLAGDSIDDLEAGLSAAMPLTQLQIAKRQVELMAQKLHRHILGMQREIKQLRSVMQSSIAEVVLRTLDGTVQSKRIEVQSATEKLDRITGVEEQITTLIEHATKQSSRQGLHVLPVPELLSTTLVSSRSQVSVLLELVQRVATLLSESDCYNACCGMPGFDSETSSRGLRTKLSSGSSTSVL